MNAFERDYDPRFRYHRDWPEIEEREPLGLWRTLLLLGLVSAPWLIGYFIYRVCR